MPTHQILLLEDQPDIQAWIIDIVKELFPADEIITADSCQQAKKLIQAYNFTIAILDINLPDGSGLDILRAIKQSSADTLCVMSTIFNDHDNIFTALQGGADGYIIKSESREKYASTLLAINNGEPPLSAQVARMMVSYFQKLPAARTEHSLTKKQSHILMLISQGMQNKEIAAELGLSVYTIMDHIKRLYLKLNISSRAEAAIKAQELGLLDQRPRND
ncbi:MAG: response regulator transcription factor [Gammaproteobacteria bacterium]|nr:response regulator transcription factor [Gammaproteobacteria bacterium]